MRTGKSSAARHALWAGLAGALVSQAAAGTEVVIAYGGEAAGRARAVEAEFRARMHEYARSLENDIRANVEKEIERIEAPRIQLALAERPTRG